MAGFHLGEETFCHVAEVKGTTLLGNHAVEQHLEQQVAELRAERSVVGSSNGVVHLVRFLDQVRPQRLVRLRRVPLAALPQILHQFQRFRQPRLFLHRSPRVRIFFRHHMIANRAVP